MGVGRESVTQSMWLFYTMSTNSLKLISSKGGASSSPPPPPRQRLPQVSHFWWPASDGRFYVTSKPRSQKCCFPLELPLLGKASSLPWEHARCLWRPPSKDLRSPANNHHQLTSHVIKPPWKWILQPHSSLWMNAAPILSIALRKTLSQNQPDKPLIWKNWKEKYDALE